jgi:hypothetical protein
MTNYEVRMSNAGGGMRMFSRSITHCSSIVSGLIVAFDIRTSKFVIRLLPTAFGRRPF